MTLDIITYMYFLCILSNYHFTYVNLTRVHKVLKKGEHVIKDKSTIPPNVIIIAQDHPSKNNVIRMFMLRTKFSKCSVSALCRSDLIAILDLKVCWSYSWDR